MRFVTAVWIEAETEMYRARVYAATGPILDVHASDVRRLAHKIERGLTELDASNANFYPVFIGKLILVETDDANVRGRVAARLMAAA